MSVDMLKFLTLIVGFFSVIALAFAIFLNVRLILPRTYLPPDTARFLIAIWSLVALVNFVGGFLNVTRLDLGLDLLLDVISYAEAAFLVLWILSMHIWVRALILKFGWDHFYGLRGTG